MWSPPCVFYKWVEPNPPAMQHKGQPRYCIWSVTPYSLEKIQNAQFWPKLCVPNFFEPFWCKKTGRNSEWSKWGNLNFLKTFWCKNTGRNLEWPKLGVPNVLKPFWCKKNGKKNYNSQKWVFQTILVQKKVEEIWNGQNWAF